MTTLTKRRPRERITRPDGSVAVQAQPPRADVLEYPRYRWKSVLVRRTHDVELARQLAEERWAQEGDGRPLSPVFRVGWWRTSVGKAVPPPSGAEDEWGRAVVWVRPGDQLPTGAGPGVEFRP